MTEHTLVDFASRYPEAIALTNTEAEGEPVIEYVQRFRKERRDKLTPKTVSPKKMCSMINILANALLK